MHLKLIFLFFTGFSCNREQKEGVFNRFCKHLAGEKTPLEGRRAKQYGTEVTIYSKIRRMNLLTFVPLTYHVFANYKLRSSKYWENWGAQHLTYSNPAEAAWFKQHIARVYLLKWNSTLLHGVEALCNIYRTCLIKRILILRKDISPLFEY